MVFLYFKKLALLSPFLRLCLPPYLQVRCSLVVRFEWQ